MEADPSPQRATPEKNPVPSLAGGSEHRVKGGFKSILMGLDLEGELFTSKVREHASSVLEFSRQWDEYDEKMKLLELSIRKQALDLHKKEERLKLVEEREMKIQLLEDSIVERLGLLQEKEEDSDLKQSLVANVMRLVLEMQNEEVFAQLKVHEKVLQVSMVKKHEELMRELEEREKELKLLDETIKEKSNELEKKAENFQLKQEAEAREIEAKSKFLEVKEKELSLLNETLKEKSNELEKKEENFQLKVEGEARETEVKSKLLELKEKNLEEREKELSLLNETLKEEYNELEKKEENFQLKVEAEVREIEAKRKFLEVKEKKLEEREKKVVELKQKELEEGSIQAETRKRSILEFEPSLLAENGRDADSLIHPAKKHKLIREYNHDDGDNETDLAQTSEAKRREVVNEVVDEEDHEPYNCPDPDFNEFNNTMSSFSVGQVWALYDPLDKMPRYYAQIRKIWKHQLRVRVTWLEPKQAEAKNNEEPVPLIACGIFKYGDTETIKTHLAFSHEMHRTIRGKNVTVNPRKGETWALFRDWNSHKEEEQHKPPYRYDFVEILSEYDSEQGVGVAYLGKVEGFTSVYRHAEQHGIVQSMIPCDEMLRFSHKVPSFKLTGDEKEGVPAGSFELDPAAIPRACLKAAMDKEENIRP